MKTNFNSDLSPATILSWGASTLGLLFAIQHPIAAANGTDSLSSGVLVGLLIAWGGIATPQSVIKFLDKKLDEEAEEQELLAEQAENYVFQQQREEVARQAKLTVQKQIAVIEAENEAYSLAAAKQTPQLPPTAGPAPISTAEAPLVEATLPDAPSTASADTSASASREADAKETFQQTGQGAEIEAAMKALGFEVFVKDRNEGPSVIQYILKLVDAKKTSQVLKVGEALQVQMSLRFKPVISIEGGALAVSVPRPNRQIVRFHDWVKKEDDSALLQLAMGVDTKNRLVQYTLNARRLESMIIGGVPSGGKSSMIAAMIGSGCLRYSPKQIQFALFDGKNGVELGWMDGSGYLSQKVAKTPEEASALVQWIKSEIARRYKLFGKADVSNLEDYNQDASEENQLPYIVCIADEFQDLFDLAAKAKSINGVPTDRDNLSSIASQGRAAGIPLILATQRPDRDVIPGQIDGKCVARLAFLLSKAVDSKLILADTEGAECLLGQGDALYKPMGSNIIRLQGLFAERKDIRPYVHPTGASNAQSFGANVKPTKEAILALKASNFTITQIVCLLWKTSPEASDWNNAVKECKKLIS